MIVRLDKITKSYPSPDGPIAVFTGLDVTLDPGDALAITGPSGCGKSTLLHILGTLDAATEGRVLFDGEDVLGRGDRDLALFRNTRIGFVFQDHYLLPQLSVIENVLVPLLVGPPLPRGAGRERARELLEAVGLASRASHRPDEISGGERQRAAIARALIRSPGLVLCDEPTGNLDAVNARRVGDLLLDLPRKHGSTLVVATHSAELAARFPRRLDLRNGGAGAAAS